ncbi:hypothetical protein [Shimia sp.]|jgi:hypothetical protein|uniref:hypothetical protein n=1 Tax=unclassified Shimia TaxID=2630038 RepID=UPI0025F3C2D5|nr:hypothetical protein [Shimia sp.]MCH2065937.1 hypothetical protein [Shimia sp.]
MPKFLFDLLKPWLGEHRAEQWFLLWYRFGVLAACAVVFAIASIALVAFFKPEKRNVTGHHWSPVLFLYSHSTESSALRIYATVRLPNGEVTTVKTSRMSKAAGTLDQICLRKLETKSGKTRYRWVGEQHCDGNI